MSSGIAEKGQIGIVSTDETPTPAKGNVHYVNRNGDNTLKSLEEEVIPGYDATLMDARATLSAAEEKKLLRRIDWHLIPLLAVMYMLKSVDFTNVRLSTEYAGRKSLTRMF
jgi:hypothetical protein